MSTPKIKIFEANIGGQWISFQTSDKTSIAKSGRVVTVTTEPRKATPELPAHDRLKTFFDLDLIPAYTLG